MQSCFVTIYGGDNGEDCASVTIHPTKEGWHLHYIRTQSGIPYPLPHIPVKSLMNMKRCKR